MSLLMPLSTRNASSTMPTELKRHIVASEMRLPRTFSASDQTTWPPSSGRNGKRLTTASTSETSAEHDEREARAARDRLLGVLGDADDALELLADLRADERVEVVR